ncbi:unnamed protein product [Cladocopium goreaui]|uniref:Uncharacterized protein n=1 Tax=Cladocopium goreaui TaxID=2562237 RepID=A0A9P1GR58_9DINO|nr:unnamed protein product [Cladocopium goreaui]
MGKLKDLLASYTQLVRGAQYLYSLLEVGGILVGLGAQIQMAKLVSTDSESRVLKSEPGASGFFMTQWICGKRIYASEIQPGRESMQRKMPRTIKRKDARSDV